VGAYGYTPAQLEGMCLSELVHPEDRAASTRIVRAAAGGRGPGRFPCRVRSADGTWRYVESTVSRYRDTSEHDRLLFTARDVSDQVALRRQLTYLTFHDGLTGLPNRTYVEDRAKDAIDRAAAVEPGRPPSGRPPRRCRPARSSSTWTASPGSTTPSGTARVTCCSPRPPAACARPCRRSTPWPAGAATSSPYSSKAPPAHRRSSRWPSGWSASSPPSRSTSPTARSP